MGKLCNTCGTENREDAKFCKGCGAQATIAFGERSQPAKSSVFCPQCGHANETVAKFCAKCGAAVSVAAGQTSVGVPSQASPSPPRANVVQRPAAQEIRTPSPGAQTQPGTAGGRKTLAAVISGVVVIAVLGGGYWAWTSKQAADELARKIERERVEQARQQELEAKRKAQEMEDRLKAEREAREKADAERQRAEKARLDAEARSAAATQAKRDAEARAAADRKAAEEAKLAAERAQREAAQRRSGSAQRPQQSPTQGAAQPQARTVREICASRGNVIARSLCEALECHKPEHLNEEYCKKQRESDGQRKERPSL